MAKITDISPQKRNKTRVSVFIDGEFACGLDAVTVAAARIKPGDDITPEELAAVTRTSEINSAFERAVGYLSQGLRSTKEIRVYLNKKEYSQEVITAAVNRLLEYRYLNDEEFARAYVSSKSKKYGKYRIKNELIMRGVDREIISELLSGDETENTVAAAQKYIRTHRTIDINKLKRYLATRGYSWDDISSALRALERDGAFLTESEDFDE